LTPKLIIVQTSAVTRETKLTLSIALTLERGTNPTNRNIRAC